MLFDGGIVGLAIIVVAISILAGGIDITVVKGDTVKAVKSVSVGGR